MMLAMTLEAQGSQYYEHAHSHFVAATKIAPHVAAHFTNAANFWSKVGRFDVSATRGPVLYTLTFLWHPCEDTFCSGEWEKGFLTTFASGWSAKVSLTTFASDLKYRVL